MQNFYSSQLRPKNFRSLSKKEIFLSRGGFRYHEEGFLISFTIYSLKGKCSKITSLWTRWVSNEAEWLTLQKGLQKDETGDAPETMAEESVVITQWLNAITTSRTSGRNSGNADKFSRRIKFVVDFQSRKDAKWKELLLEKKNNKIEHNFERTWKLVHSLQR